MRKIILKIQMIKMIMHIITVIKMVIVTPTKPLLVQIRAARHGNLYCRKRKDL
jgi:hypothetical protein